MYVERKGGEEEALVPEEEHAEFVKLRDEGEAPEPEPTHTPMTWTKLAYCSALLALLITIPCVLYPPSELAKYWYFFGDPEWYVLLIFTIVPDNQKPHVPRESILAVGLLGGIITGFIGIGIEKMLYMLLTMHPRRVEVDTTQAGVSCITVAGRVSNHIFDPTSM
ncbi:hypothetical protein JL720_2901 [Aureococcus anophagefferens]|nr:hypothetical protein JL720_2901 [Aureococcus anophagefferens]